MAVILCGSFVGFVCLQNWISRKSENVNTVARPAFETLLRAYLRAKITGEYWDDEILRQSKIVSKFPLTARVDFYRELILVCDLDMSNAKIFVEIVGEDMQPLQKDLQNMKASQRYQNASNDERKKIDDWLVEIQNLARYIQDFEAPDGVESSECVLNCSSSDLIGQ